MSSSNACDARLEVGDLVVDRRFLLGAVRLEGIRERLASELNQLRHLQDQFRIGVGWDEHEMVDFERTIDQLVAAANGVRRLAAEARTGPEVRCRYCHVRMSNHVPDETRCLFAPGGQAWGIHSTNPRRIFRPTFDPEIAHVP